MERGTHTVRIIAEAGVNHNGSVERALEMVDAAAAAGADIVKFQTFRTGALVSADAPKATYQTENTDESSAVQMLAALELSEAAHEAIIERCRERGIEFLSTAFDFGSIDYLVRLGITTFKIPSGEITDLPYLRRIGALGLHVILSTGMATMTEIGEALDAIEAAGTARADIVVLHCTTEYPAPLEDVNLRAMCTIGSTFGVAVGYSDHTSGIEVPVAAVALGATIIEKHFTLDRRLPGPDHKASLEPDELGAMVRAIRNTEAALGDGVKRPMPSELGNAAVVRKSIVASRPIAQGETFSEDNLTVKRPGTGVSPMRWDELIGRPARRAFAEDEQVEP